MRLSKLQKWILEEWENKDFIVNTHFNGNTDTNVYHNTYWIYEHYYNIKGYKELRQKDKPIIPNKIKVSVYRSLTNLHKKGLINIEYRGNRGKGFLIFKRCENGRR